MSSIASLLGIQKGLLNTPARACIYGPSGVGKTTLASKCPSPLFMDVEKGSNHLDVERICPESWSDVTFAVKALISEQHTFKTLVIDTADWLEKLLIVDLCSTHNKESIEEFNYGKGYTLAAEAFLEFLKLLESLRAKGMHVVFTAHSQIRKFEQPDQSGSFDRFELKLSKQIAPLLKEWCDMMLFCTFETKVVEVDGKKRGIGGKERIIHTSHTAAWDAKNRHQFPEKLPFSFASIAKAFSSASAHHTETENTNHLEVILSLWEKLEYGQEQMGKLFEWLGADSLKGTESWSDLSQEQQGKAVEFLKKKLMEKEAC
ncbi:MAG: ATP-binding protein [Opitutales bacterium]|nr:ATP-binding protein [Opitutales bacterium]